MDNHANEFYNTMISNFYSPFILQPTLMAEKAEKSYRNLGLLVGNRLKNKVFWLNFKP